MPGLQYSTVLYGLLDYYSTVVVLATVHPNPGPGYCSLQRLDCTKAKQERYAASNSAQEAPPKYDDATEKRLDAWVAAKRSHAFDAADKLRAALRADGIDTEAARPLGYQPPAAAKSAKKVKCFNCGKVGHRSEECTAVAAGSTACYICGMEGHKGRDCPMAPEKKAFDPKAAKCFQCGQVGHLSAACPQPKAKDASFYCCVGPTAHKDEEFALMSSWEVLMKSQLASQKMDCAWLLQRSRLGKPDLERS